MSLVTLDGAAVLRLDLIIPQWGPHHSDVQLEGSVAPAVGARVSLNVAGTSRVGTVIRAGAPYQQPRVRVVGGAGKLDTVIEPKDYGQTTLAAVVSDILTMAGETVGNLDALQAVVVQQYQLVQQRAWNALQSALGLAKTLNLWCEHDGSFSVRETVWTQSVGALWRGVVPQEAMVQLFGDVGTIEPGVTVTTVEQGDFNVNRVQYKLDPTDQRSQLSINAWYV